MPVVFQQPEPIRPDISTGYGGAEQWSRDYPALQRSQQGIAEATLQAASIQQRAAQAQAALQQQSFQHSAALDQSSWQSNQQYGLAREQMAHQSNMLDQHAQLQDQLAQAQLSRGEALRLQRLQEARGTIQEQVQNGTLTPEEGNDALMQIQTGISPLQQRQQRAQQAHVELQNQQLQRQTAEFDRLQQQREQHRTSAAQDQIEVVTDPSTGEDYTFHRDENGRRTFIGSRGTGSAVWHPGQSIEQGGGSQAGRTRTPGGQQGGGEGEQPFNPQIHQAAVREATATTARDANGHAGTPSPERIQEIYNRMSGMGQQTQRGPSRAQVQQQVWQEVQQAFPQLPIAQQRSIRDREVARRVEEAGRPAAELAQATREATAEVDANNYLRVEGRNVPIPAAARQQLIQQATQRRLQGMRQPQQPTAQPTPLVQHATAEARDEASRRPFNAAELGAMPGPQREAASDMNRLRQSVEQATHRVVDGRSIPVNREDLTDNLNRMQRLMTQYGTEAAMTPADRTRYRQLRASLANLRVQSTNRQERTALEDVQRGGGMLTGEILGVPERVGRVFQGQEQRPFGQQPYR